MDRGRVDRRGNVHELEVEGAARQLQRAHVAHEREVRVVDGERELVLIVERGGVLSARRRRRGGQRVGTAVLCDADRQREGGYGQPDPGIHEQSPVPGAAIRSLWR